METPVKFQVDRRELMLALEKVSPGLTTEEVLEQSDCFVFLNGRLMTYNDNICVNLPLTFGGWNGAVKSQKLLSILSKMDATSVMVEVSDKELRISSNKSRMGIPAQHNVLLPVQEVKPPESGSDSWKALPKDFTTALRFCMFSTARDAKAEQILNCIHVKGNQAESCDDFRATRYTMESGLESDLLIPRLQALQLAKLSLTHIAVDSAFLHFITDDHVVFSCRRVSFGYPNLDKLLTVEGQDLTLPDTLGETLQRAGVFSSDNEDDYVEIQVQGGMILVTGKGNSGWFQERDKCTFPGNISFFINPATFREALAVMHTIKVTDNRIGIKGDKFIHAVCLSQVS
jgi:DNA polymerase III sliding clamp (beta) subunit (PCNA family)